MSSSHEFMRDRRDLISVEGGSFLGHGSCLVPCILLKMILRGSDWQDRNPRRMRLQ